MSKRRISALDGVRVLAIAEIMLYHFNEFFYISNWFLMAVGAGVICCTALSGFLIGVFSDGKFENATWKESLRFYSGKLAKFYPVHLLTFIFMLPLYYRWYGCSVHTIIKQGISGVVNLLLLQSWIPNNDILYGFNGVSWYLSTILFLYAVTPFTVCWLRKLQKRYGWGITGLLMALMLLIFDVIALMVWISPVLSETVRHWYLSACPIRHYPFFTVGIYMGMLYAACYSPESQTKKQKLWKWVPLVLGCCIVQKLEISNYQLLPVILVVFVVLLTPGLGQKYTLRFLGGKYMTFLASFSFEMFMFHQIVAKYLYEIRILKTAPAAVGMLLCIVLSLVGSYCLHQVCVWISKQLKTRSRTERKPV